jgi:hypothetical protein
MNESASPVAFGSDPGFRELRQITVREDEGIAAVNALLAEGWRVMSIGHRPDAAVYVLARTEQKQRARTGFLPDAS